MFVPATPAEFYRALSDLQKRFDAMQPELELTLRDPSLGVEGHVVVWNTEISKRGPLPLCAKGGCRIRSGLSLDEVKMLARKMAIKNAAAALPLGGCKSGINADPKQAGFELRYRRFVAMCKPLLYENGGTFGGFGFDIGAAPEHAIWACDTLGSPRCFTGKTVEMGGTDYDKEGIAGLGVSEAALALMEFHNDPPSASTTFAVHGLGAMGAAVLRYFSVHGPRLTALGDPKFAGTWRFPAGISEALQRALVEQNNQRAHQLIQDEGSKISSDPNQVLFEAVDVLFPCALHRVITRGNAHNIAARYLSEGANNPCDIDAYPLLFERGLRLVPDFIANCGGIIAAFVELTSDISLEENRRSRRKVTLAKESTQKKIRDNVATIAAHSQSLAVPLRDVALYVSLSRIILN